jgi:cytochrome c biogenesis protein ResB
VVHLSILILIVGGIISFLGSDRGRLVLVPGETVSIVRTGAEETTPLGFSLTLEEFEVEFYESHPGRPKSYVSKLTVTPEEGESYKYDIAVNHPLIKNGFTIYQSSYGRLDADEHSHSSAHDTVKIELRLRNTPTTVPAILERMVTLGDTIAVPGFGDSLEVVISEIYRNFKRGEAGTPGDENPAVQVTVLADSDPRWELYAFKKFPGMNMPMVDDFDLVINMLELHKQNEGIEVPAENSDYYTVLGVVRDDGIPVVWAGAICMMLGLFLSFYIRPRRICIVADGDSVIIGGSTKGDDSAFRTYITNIVIDNR